MLDFRSEYQQIIFRRIQHPQSALVTLRVTSSYTLIEVEGVSRVDVGGVSFCLGLANLQRFVEALYHTRIRGSLKVEYETGTSGICPIVALLKLMSLYHEGE